MHGPILVGDIGSTKSTWWYGLPGPTELHLQGYNPVSHAGKVRSDLFTALRNKTGAIEFSAIWYYGAGVIDQDISSSIQMDLQNVFPQSKVHVYSDLAGACLAACGKNQGSIAILGTGSHAAVWNGHKIIRQANSLGYILGDEGSGCDIGKALIQAYFYQELPEPIHSFMTGKLPRGRNGLLSDLHASATPNQFLADFAKVAVLFQEDSWIKAMISSRFELFITRHVLPLTPDRQVHIVGSIGCIFASLINQALAKNHLTAGDFIKDPALRLFERHHEHGKK